VKWIVSPSFVSSVNPVTWVRPVESTAVTTPATGESGIAGEPESPAPLSDGPDVSVGAGEDAAVAGAACEAGAAEGKGVAPALQAASASTTPARRTSQRARTLTARHRCCPAR